MSFEGFPWSECQLTDDKSLYRDICKIAEIPIDFEIVNRETRGSVYSHRLSYFIFKVRIGGDFFYGKTSY